MLKASHSSFHGAPGLLMSPTESSSGSTSASSNSTTSPFPYSSLSHVIPDAVTSSEGFPASSSSSAYSNPASLQWNERMTDYRIQRVPALQPPSGMSPPLQTQGAMVPGSTGLIARGDGYSSISYMNRSTFPPPHNSGLSDMSRYSHYPGARGSLGMHSATSTASMYSHALIDSPSRSSQNTEAPPFHETSVLHTIVTSSQTIKPEIQAKIHKGFFQVDDKWTCYRRNYFSVSCSFSLRPWTPNVALYIQLANHTEVVRNFSMSISAVVNAQESEIRELVQHTPKRDKQSEKKPPRVTLQPQQPPSLVMNHGPSVGNHMSFAAPPHPSSLGLDYSSYGAPPQPSQPPTSHTFERIQFQKATANNGKRRAQQQYYNLVVELYAEVTNSMGNSGDTQWILIARRLSHPMVVRGRSPGHYKDGRRDSSASMGPDGSAGSSADGHGGTGLPPGLGHRSHLSLMSYDPSGRGNSRFGYRQMTSTDHSPLTASPLVSSSSSSPGFEYTMIGDSMDPMDTIKDEQYGDQTYTTASSDGRKMCIEQSNVRMHLPGFEEDTSAKGPEEHDGPFTTEAYDPMIPILHNEPDSSFKQNGTSSYLHHHRQSPGPKFGSVYAERSRESSYGRFDMIHNPQSLCS
ncbi:hypothetical protein AJ80_04354 [Polytolypa hystricis UAMH7299]|uniref:NDT80 domain-containing protein n=1 Tax=Polytolypa hystricis (strain UAMH7299) TaxID=1447883 RepID=A0A2B7YCB3_POLH7|nr:hypothetical protein AJ80_04354 [Polytolypa hystricis UAMH7299]